MTPANFGGGAKCFEKCVLYNIDKWQQSIEIKNVQAPVVQKLDSAILRISIREINCAIHWIEICPQGAHTMCLCNRLLFYSKFTGFTISFTYNDMSLSMYIN